ncbi:hypothetical protein FQZ97_459400 [compost metagenome]
MRAGKRQPRGHHQGRKTEQVVQLVLLVNGLWQGLGLQAGEQDDRQHDKERQNTQVTHARSSRYCQAATA